MVLNPTLDVLSDIPRGGCNFQVDNILIHMNSFKDCLYAGRALQGSRDVTEMIYPTNISAFVNEGNRQIVTNYSIVLFNTQVKALSHDVHICILINIMLDSLMHHNESFKGVAG